MSIQVDFMSKKKWAKIATLLVLFLSAGTPLSAQILTILSEKEKTPLPGVNIFCGSTGISSDLDGKADLSALDCESFTISYVGYQSVETTKSNAGTVIYLRELINELDVTTVTASKYERRLSETTVSVDVLKPALIKSINTTSGSEVLNKLPGVQVVGGQANIRGGSGFSYGAGSRVMILIDDIPALQADAGYANWGDIPIEHLGQIEVVKGAASSLYGSSALNGIVNFRRKTPGINPSLSVFTSGTIYQDPEDLRSKWWGDTTARHRVNAGFSYAQKKGKTDLGLHGFVSNTQSYNFETYEKKVRLGANTRILLSDRLSLNFNVLGNYNQSSDFFIWRNAIRGIFQPFSGTISSGNRLRLMFDPGMRYEDKSGNIHRIFTRVFYTDNQNNNNQSNSSVTTYGEYQLQRNVDDLALTLTGGIVGSMTDTEAELFDNEQFLYRNMALYGQAEKSWQDKLVMSAGLRYEYNRQDSPEKVGDFDIPGGKVTDGALIGRFGLNYKLHEYSNFRVSWGQGYRYPTVTERFINTSFGGFQISPNPLLKPEYGFTAEAGLKQGFDLKIFKGFFDVSAFLSDYTDMIEFNFETDPFGFRPVNVGNTRIYGYETSLIGKFDIWKIPVTTLAGYTYIDPFYKDFESNKLISESVSAGKNVLKYRSKHSAKLDLEASYFNFTLGGAWQYYSNMVNIDKAFEEPVSGLDIFEIKAFRRLNPNGFNTYDVRIGYLWKQFKVSFIGANLANRLYTVRPGLAEAPRNFTLRIEYEIQ